MLKKTILTIIFITFSATVFTSNARENDEKYRQEYHKLIGTIGPQTLGFFIDKIFNSLDTNLGEERIKELKTDMMRVYEDWISHEMYGIYRKHITLKELKQLNKFYQTPTGRKFAEVQPMMMFEAMNNLEGLITRLRPLLEEALGYD